MVAPQRAGPLRAALALWAALLVPAALRGAAGQGCSESSVRSRGAAGDGNSNDAWAFRSMDGDGGVGVIYMPDGVYRIAESLTLTKPVMGSSGAVFSVDWGCTLELVNQPEHPLTTFFTGWGTVLLTGGTVRAYPEWFGARGNGATDDADALRRAFNAVAQTSNGLLYLTQSYGLGSELQLNNKATIFSQPTARLVSVNGNSKGLTFTAGGFAYKNVAPHVSGFSEFCIRLLGSDLAALQLHTLSNCGDAIRLEAYPDGDYAAALDNTVWFDAIRDSRVGIAFQGSSGCSGAGCVFQGNQFVGNAITGGPASGQAAAFAYRTPESKQPAWDSNQFDIAIVTPPKSNPEYVLCRAYPQTDRAIIKIARLDPLPPGARMFSGAMNMMQVTIQLGQQLAENSIQLSGLLNLVTLTGATNPLPGAPPVRCSRKQGNKAGFNGGRALVGNTHDLIATPDSDWQAGEVRVFYIYHQLATGDLYQIKCTAPAGPGGGPTLDCVQYNDNTWGSSGVPATPNELQLYLINLTGATIPAWRDMPFTVAVATLANPVAATA